MSPVEGQVYHNRLTHTVEVAQIGQRLAEQFLRTNTDHAKELGLDPSVVETAALAHDLGHPPFGHIAEKELNRRVLAEGEVDGYEGNAQSFRVVTKLAVRNENLGLNLTRASLNAALKYPRIQCPTSDQKQQHRKWGAYSSEVEDFGFAREGHKGTEVRALEAQLMDWADDIAYSIHDTEDFYRAGLVPLGQLSMSGAARDRFLQSVFERWDQKRIPAEFAIEDLAACFHRVCEALPFDGPYEPSRDQRAQLRTITSNFIGRYITATKLRPAPDADGEILDVDPELRMQVKMLKELTWQYVIKGPSLLGMQRGQKRIINSLFDIFIEATLSDDPHGKWPELPSRNRADMEYLRAEHGAAIPRSSRIRVAADAIAGMTDQQAILMYHRLTGVSCGSVLDAIVV